MAMEDTKFYTVNQVATKLSLSPRTIRRKIQNGEIFAMKIGNSEKAPIRILDSELDRLIRIGYEKTMKYRNE